MAVWNSFPDVDLDWWGWRREEENNNMIYFNTLFNWILLNSFREVVQGATSTAKDLLKVNQQQAPKTWPTVHFLYLHFFFCFLPQGMREIYTSLVREGDVFDYFFGNFRIIVICFYDSWGIKKNIEISQCGQCVFFGFNWKILYKQMKEKWIQRQIYHKVVNQMPYFYISILYFYISFSLTLWAGVLWSF